MAPSVQPLPVEQIDEHANNTRERKLITEQLRTLSNQQDNANNKIEAKKQALAALTRKYEQETKATTALLNTYEQHQTACEQIRKKTFPEIQISSLPRTG